MDCRVDAGQIIPVSHRIICDPKGLTESNHWRTYEEGILAFSDQDRDTITAALDELKIPYTIEAVDQPDAALLAACQGKVRTRSAALAALAAGKPPVTLADLDQRLTNLEPSQP